MPQPCPSFAQHGVRRQWFPGVDNDDAPTRLSPLRMRMVGLAALQHEPRLSVRAAKPIATLIAGPPPTGKEPPPRAVGSSGGHVDERRGDDENRARRGAGVARARERGHSRGAMTPDESEAVNRAADQVRRAAFALPRPELAVLILTEALGETLAAGYEEGEEPIEASLALIKRHGRRSAPGDARHGDAAATGAAPERRPRQPTAPVQPGLARTDLERLAEAAFSLASAKRRVAAINDANVHLKSHHELVEIEKMMVEARVERLKAD
jgi:hypothetical protein